MGQTTNHVRQRGAARLIERQSGENCGYDGCQGTLVESEYKGNQALVCSGCGTPAVRTW